KSLKRDSKKIPCSLLHLDYHWDGVNDFNADAEKELLCATTGIEEIYKIVSKGNLVRKDSFIAPSIIRRIIDEVHFLCFQGDMDNLTPPGLDDELLKRYS